MSRWSGLTLHPRYGPRGPTDDLCLLAADSKLSRDSDASDGIPPHRGLGQVRLYSALVVVQAAATIALGLLGLAGIAKVVDPQPTSGALAGARLPSQPWLVRSLGLVEIAAATFGLAIGSLAALPAALLYLGFTLFTLVAVRGNRLLQSCGCFGKEDTPPSWLHVSFNIGAVFALFAVVVSGQPTIPWTGPLGELLGYAAFAGLGVYAAYLMLTALPRTLAVSRQ